MKTNKPLLLYKRFRPDVWAQRMARDLDIKAALTWPIEHGNWKRALLVPAVIESTVFTLELMNKFLFHVNPGLSAVANFLNWAGLAFINGYYWQQSGLWQQGGMQTEAMPWNPDNPNALVRLWLDGWKVILFTVLFLMPLMLWTLALNELPWKWLAHLATVLSYVGYLFALPYAAIAILTSAPTQSMKNLFSPARTSALAKKYYQPTLRMLVVGGGLAMGTLPLFVFCFCSGPLFGIYPAYLIAFSYHLATQVFAEKPRTEENVMTET